MGDPHQDAVLLLADQHAGVLTDQLRRVGEQQANRHCRQFLAHFEGREIVFQHLGYFPDYRLDPFTAGFLLEFAPVEDAEGFLVQFLEE